MRIKYMERSEAIHALRNAAPEDLIQELVDRGATTNIPNPSALLNKLTECPHCGKKGKVGKDFGIRVLGGTVRPQSWCRDCRKNPIKAAKATRKASPQNKSDMVETLRESLKNAGVKASQLRKLQKAFAQIGKA